MRQFNADRRSAFFDDVFAPVQERDVREAREAWLHPRDRILLERILPKNGRVKKAIDFGCGQGRLLAELGHLGISATGIEPSESMRAVAESNCRDIYDVEVVAGGIEALAEVEDDSIDLFIAMGVFQYLSDDENNDLMSEAARLLTTDGCVIATYQNALFDLFTFNKYTLDFITNDLLSTYTESHDSSAIETALSSLMTRPGEPGYAEHRARDNIFVRLTNPLTHDSELARCGWTVLGRYFYEYFGLPPLVKNDLPEVAAYIAGSFEVVNAEAWQGHFLANAFLVELALSDE